MLMYALHVECGVVICAQIATSFPSLTYHATTSNMPNGCGDAATQSSNLVAHAGTVI